jgi:hypothetical protein
MWKFKSKSAIEETEEPKPESKERTMMVSELTEGLGRIETGIKKFEHIYSNSKQQQQNKKLPGCLLAFFLACLP